MRRLLPLVAAGVLVPALVEAQVTQLLFDSFLDREAIGSFYAGGAGGTGHGPSLGIDFSANELAITSRNAGGTGNFQGNPSGSGIMFWLAGTDSYVNVASGFGSGFSLYYSAVEGFGGSVTIWDGLNGTGSVLGTLQLPAFQSGVGTAACPLSGKYCSWTAAGTAFSGTARSVTFNGTANFIGFDNLTFGSADPSTMTVVDPPPITTMPEPATLALLGTGLLALGAVAARRRRGG